MDRRRFLAALAGGLVTAGGCATNEPTGSTAPGTAPSPAARPGTVHAGPAVTARAPDRSTDLPSATPVVATSTETVTMTASRAGDDGGAGGDAGAPPAPTTPTGTPARTPSSPLRMTLSSVTVQRVVGELTCTAGPLAWMAVEIGFLRDGEPVESERRRRAEPGTGETLAFDVDSEEPALHGVRLATAFAYPTS